MNWSSFLVLVVTLFTHLRSEELGCYEPLCDQGTAYFSSILGLPGLDLFVDSLDFKDLNGICIKTIKIGSTINALKGIVEYCTADVENGHIHIPLSLEDNPNANENSIKHSFLQVIPRFVYKNGTWSIGKSSSYFVLCIEGFDKSASTVSKLSSVFIRSPRFGSRHAHQFHASYLASLKARQESSTMQFSIESIHEQIINTKTTLIDARAVAGTGGLMEPASWFFSITPLLYSSAQKNGVSVLPGVGYIEMLLPSEELVSQRWFASQPYAQVAPTANVCRESRCPSHEKPINVCVWASSEPDGQKRIYLDQIETLPEDIIFTYILSSQSPLTNTADIDRPLNDVEQKLFSLMTPTERRRARVNVVASPMIRFTLNTARFSEPTADGSELLPKDATYEQVIKYTASRFEAAAGDIDAITPDWAREPYIIIRNALQNFACDITVNGNVRGVTADFFITKSARSLGIPSVSELLNLFVDAAASPDVIVGPSEFAVEHPSVSWLRTARNGSNQCLSTAPALPLLPEVSEMGLQLQRHACGPLTAVVPPGVNVHMFDPDRTDLVLSNSFVARVPECKFPNCLTVGFLARLSGEKNPGLFLQAAHAILQQRPNTRFLVIGDGPLANQLRVLGARLGISDSMVYTGWVAHDELPALLALLDVLVNTSVRGWSETFCIANIEAMAMRVPLVTFAAGGVGQYVREPRSDGIQNQHTHFYIGENALLVNDASPQAIASAVLHLLNDSVLRTNLGVMGRLTVTSNFRNDQQMWRYEQLYRYLYQHNSRTERMRIA